MILHTNKNELGVGLVGQLHIDYMILIYNTLPIVLC